MCTGSIRRSHPVTAHRISQLPARHNLENTLYSQLLFRTRNWVYVDKSTFEVKFGVRASAETGFKGPFDCTRQDRRLTLGGWEGFLAVKEGDFWA